MKKLACLVFLALLASTALLAQVDIPLRNWTVPPYTVNTSRGIHTMNMETAARRLGWDRIWEERARPAPAPAP